MSASLKDPVENLPPGMRMVLPGPNDLFVDIDDGASLTILHQGISMLSGALLTLTLDKLVPSSTPGHFHAYVTIANGLCLPHPIGPDGLNPAMRIIFQTILGSDRAREAFSLLTIMQGCSYPPTCFYEPIEAGAQI